MSKKRKFKRADYEATAKTQITLGEALPEDHLARFVARIIGLLDLSEIYAKYGDRGGMPYAPEVLLGLLLYGYATGTFVRASWRRRPMSRFRIAILPATCTRTMTPSTSFAKRIW